MNGGMYPPLSFVGAMKIARNLAVSECYVEWYAPSPAPSLRELSRPQGVTEGVSFDGCSMPTIYIPAHIDSEIFERLRSSGYTPSVSLRSTAPSGREPGMGECHSSGCSLMSGVTGDFHRPYEGRVPFNRVLANVRGFGRFSSPLRNSEDLTLYHSTDCH